MDKQCPRSWRRRVVVASVLAGALATMPVGSAQDATTASQCGDLKFRFIGPTGNQASAVAGVPEDPKTYYIGAASGGIFRTSDAGATWEPVFDD